MSIKSMLLCFLVFISGCSNTNKYQTYYGDYGNMAPSGENKNKASSNPKLIDTFDLKEKVAQYEAKGYVVLGVSSFDGEWESRTKAIDHAKAIGATLVVVQSSLTGQIAQQYTISVPTANTAYHSGSVYTSYGSSATYFGQSTTYGSQQFRGSYSLGQYQQVAVFLVKGERQ